MRFEIDFLESHDSESIVAELQRIAGLLGKRTVRGKDIDKYGRLSSRTVVQRFGTLRRALEAAGLDWSRYTKSTDEELIKVISDLWQITLKESGRRPRLSELAKYRCPVSSSPITERFGTWKKALAATARAMEEPEDKKPAVIVRTMKQRKPLSVNKRFFVFKRDGYMCRICRQLGGELEVDHIIPVSLGGPDTTDNLQTVCKECNRSRGNQLM